MTAGTLVETAAWILSAVIAVWLLFDMLRTGRRHRDHDLVRAETLDEPVEDEAR